jgi:hypothetical protein
MRRSLLVGSMFLSRKNIPVIRLRDPPAQICRDISGPSPLTN